MTNIENQGDRLMIHFPGWETMMAGRRAFDLPHGAVRSARVEEGWTSEILGARSGLVISGYRKLGTFTHPDGTRRLVSMKRGVPLLRLVVDRAETGFDEILVSTDHAHGIVDGIELAAA